MTGLSTFYSDYPQTTLRGLGYLALSELAVIQRGTVTSDGGGGGTTIWQNVSTTVCRIDPAGGRGGVIAGQISELANYVITMPGTVVVDPTERVAIVGRGTFALEAVPQRTDLTYHRIEAVEI